MVLSFGDRLFDGCVLGALAWVTARRTIRGSRRGRSSRSPPGSSPPTSAREGGSLGYGIEEGVVTPALRYGLVSVGLIAGLAVDVVGGGRS